MYWPERNTAGAVAVIAFGLLLGGCTSGSYRDSSETAQVSSALNGPCTPSSPCSIWPTTTMPAGASSTTPVELGVKVQSSQAGYITGVRFFKDDTNSTHTVSLWSLSGSLLATASSSGETSVGWQSVSFAQPVVVSANTTYVASYFMPGGGFALDRPGFSTAVVNAPLTALADSQSGGNGVFAYGSSSSFPGSSYGASNYWVDVLFSATTPAVCTPTSPCSIWPTTATPARSDTTTSVELGVKLQASQSGYITGVRFYKDDTNSTHTVSLWDLSGNLLATATSSGESSTGWQTVSFPQTVAVTANTTYVASYFMPGGNFALDRPGFSSAVVNAPLTALADGQSGGNGVFAYGSSTRYPSSSYAASNYWVDILFSATSPSTNDGGAACTPSSPCSIWSTTATPVASASTTAVELGVKVQSSQAGFITGVRFYKDDTNNATHTVNFWSLTGTRLGTANSTGESNAGWQTVSFAQPVAVSANTTYVASYFMPGGNFPLNRPGLSAAVVNPPLTALADGQNGGNGVFAYGSSSSFPGSSYGATNYWVDILFSATAPAPPDGGAGEGGGATDGGVVAYPQQYATAFCTGIANCCGVDGGTFDFPTCQSDWSVGGYRGLPSILPAPDVVSRGNLTFDASRAAGCIAAVQSWPCGSFTAAANASIISACLNVLGGTIAIGGTGCMSSFECLSGSYCNAGTCTSLVAQGGACTLDEQCTYVGTIQPALACDLYPGDGGVPSTGTCQPAKGTGGACYNGNSLSDLMCTSQLCNDTVSTCGATATNPWISICASYMTPPG